MKFRWFLCWAVLAGALVCGLSLRAQFLPVGIGKQAAVGGQSIVSVAPTAASFLSTAAAGTTIAAVAVTMSSGPAFSGTVALQPAATTDAGCTGATVTPSTNFQLSGTTLPSNLQTGSSAPLVAGTYCVHLVATQAGVTTFTQIVVLTSGAYSGPLDVVTTPAALACYSMRACSKALATAGATALNLTRASDSHTCNAILAASGGLNPNTAGCGVTGENNTALTTWCASTTCSVAWVNQSGSWPVMAAGANGVALAFSGCSSGSLPCLVFATDQSTYLTELSAASPTDAVQPFSISGVFTGQTSGAYCYVYSGDNAAGARGLNDPAAGTGGFKISSDGTNFTATAGPLGATSWYATQGYFSGTSSVLRSNGAEVTGNAGTNSLTQGTGFFRLSGFGSGDYAQAYAGRMTEFIVFANPGLSSALRSALETNQKSYFGF
jgi:hypothetical protein